MRSLQHPTRQWQQLRALNKLAAHLFLRISIRIQVASTPSPLGKEFLQIPEQLCLFIFMDNLLICMPFMELPKEYGWVEDCSQAHGAEIDGQKVGTFGSLAAFSCYPTKNLGGTGDGGVILCRSKELSEKIKTLRQYGWNEARESIISGFNSRLDELQAAILRVKLKHLGMTMPNA